MSKVKFNNAIAVLKRDIIATERRLDMKSYIDVEHKLDLEDLLLELKAELHELELESEGA